MTDLITPARQPLSQTQALVAGLRWMYDTRQPADAWMQHHGERLYAEDNRYYSFVPVGAYNRPVIVVNVSSPTWTRHPREGDMRPGNPLAPDELRRLVALLEQRGLDVDRTWNGFPAHTGSVGLRRPANPTQIAAVRRYHAGCPDHPTRTVFCDCDAWRAGFRRAVKPTV